MHSLYLRQPNLTALLVALAAAALVWILAQVSGHAEALALRMVFAAALPLYALDVVETSRIGTGTEASPGPDHLAFGGAAGWSFAAFLTLAGWNGVEAAQRVILAALVGGGVLGLLLTRPWRRQPTIPTGRYDITKPITERPIAGRLYQLWPALCLAFVAALLVFPPPGGWTAGYLMGQMVILPFLIPRFPAQSGGGLSRHPVIPRVAGVALLVAGFTFLSR